MFCPSCGQRQATAHQAAPPQPSAPPATQPAPAAPPYQPPAGYEPPPPAYPYPPAPVQTRTSGFAIAGLVLGIIWIYWIGSILALVFGYIAKGQIDKSNGTLTGRGMAVAAIVLGWIGVGILILIIILGIIGAASAPTPGG
jgi:uncharacterized membrane protein